MEFIIVLPTFGSPYIWTGLPIDKKDMLKTLQKVVQGPIEEFKNNSMSCMKIHSMFGDDDKRWQIARSLLENKTTKIYVNEEGMYSCSPNMATILCVRDFKGGSITLKELQSLSWKPKNPMFGDIALVVSEKVLKCFCDNKSYMTLFGDEPYEPYDEKAHDDMKEFVKKMGMEYKEGSGQIYLSNDILGL